MKKIVSITLVSACILSSCGSAVTEEVKTEKLPFQVETKQVKDFSSGYSVEKTGRLVGSSTISLASQGVGRVSQVLVKEWANVKKGQLLVALTDTTANYDIHLDQAKNGVKNASVSTESTKLSLDKAVDDTKMAMERSRLSYETLKSDSAKKLEKAERDAKKSDMSSTSSDASVTITQLESSLAKAKLDYENLKNANVQTIKNFDSSVTLFKNDLKKFLSKTLYDSDKLFGITDAYRFSTTSNQIYMGVRDPSLRAKLERSFSVLKKAADDFENASSPTITEENVFTELSTLSDKYILARDFLSIAIDYLQASIASSDLPQSAIDAYVAQFTGYKTELSGLETAQISFKNTTNTFLNTYKNTEASAAAGLDVQEKQILTQKNALQNGQFDANLGLERTKISINNDVEQARIAYENSVSTYNNAVSNRTITLEKLSVSKTDANLTLEQAQNDFAKLSVVSPIDGTITRVSVSVGQELGAGTPVIEVVNKNPEVLFDLDSTAVALLKIGATEMVSYDGATYTGTVVGVSQVASDSLLYTARVSLSDSPKYLGGIATISLHLNSEYPIFPIEAIKVISESLGEVSVFSGGTIAKESVKLGKVTGKMVEVLSKMNPEEEVIVNDTSRFDEQKFFLQKK